MKISIVLLICVGAVSSFSLKAKRAGDEPFTLTFGSGAVNTGCAYKGATYAQGQQWRDGCQYTCVCEDATSGRYKCTDICPTYADVPPQCPLVKSPGECCAKPQCHFSASGSGSSGSGTGTGMLTSGTSGTGMTGGGSCADKLPNCKDYGADVCTNPDFVKWAHENCCAFCHYGSSSMGGGSMTGGTGTQTGGTMTGGTGTQTGGTMTGGGDASCVDTIDNCAAYTTSVCSDNSFSKWVDEHCRKFCNRCSGGSSGSGTGTMTGTGGTGTGNGGTFFGGGTTGGTGTGTGTGTMTGTGGTGTMTGGTGTCYDKIPDCAKYTQSTCADPNYTQWVKDNCPKYCGQCGSGTMTGGQTGPGTVILPGGSATYCMDKLQNCKDYPADTCSSYRDWSQTNCAKTCNMCSGGSGTFTGTGTGTGTGTFTGTGTGTGTGTFPGTGTGTGTGTFTGTGTGTGTMTGGTCVDKVSNCAALDQSSHICTDQGAKIYAQQNCPAYCRLCSTGTGGSGSGSFPGSGTSGTGGFTGTGTGTGGTGTFTGTGGTGGSGGTGGVVTGGQATGTGSTSTGYCADVLTNCAAYGTGICTNAQYASWVSANCAKFCNKCSGGSMSGTGTFTGTGTGTGTGSMTGTGSGSVGGMTGSSSGCVYAGHVYQQGQSWKDGCKFSCQCVDGTSGKYQCKSLCVQWQLPQACHMNPPAAGKCCPTPNCPAGFDLQYPVDYVEQ